MAKACAGCHLLPPPEILPRERWRKVIPDMATMPGPAAAPTADDVAAALRWYEALAPDALPGRPQAAAISTALRFRVEHFTPKGIDRKIPATSHVRFEPMNAPPRLDLVVSEMRSRSLHLLEPWRKEGERRLLFLSRDLGYPAGVARADVDRDGDQDLVVAGLGGMDPVNAPQGLVSLLLEQPDHRFQRVTVAEGLGRVAAAHPADLDGDGDVDLVAAAFGWRGPGALTVLEQTAQAGGPVGPGAPSPPPRFGQRVLDERDGFLDALPVDLDGDGDLDLVAALAQEHEQVIAFVNQGGLSFAPRLLDGAPHPCWGTSGLSLVDLDRDGDVDVLVSNGDALDDNLLKPYHGVRWLENRGGLSFVPREIGHVHGCEAAAAGDLDGDGDLDVVATSFLPQLPLERTADVDSIVWFERLADGGWARHALEKGRCLHPTLALGDHDADGRLDLAVGNYVWLVEDGRPLCEADWVTVFTQQAR